MNRMRAAASVAALALLAGCAGSSRSRPSSGLATRTENGDKVICQMERPLGSNIAEMVCRTQESVDANRQAAQDSMRAMSKNAPGQQSQ